MTGLVNQKLYRLQCPITGHYLHFTRLDLTTQDDRQAWCGTENMIKGVRKVHPHTRGFKIVLHKKERVFL